MQAMETALDRIEDAIQVIASGGMIIVVDDENRENEGDLVMAADCATPEAVAFMMRFGRGLICAPMSGARLDALEVPLMVARNEDSHQTAFTVSVDLAQGTSTGISASDRARTLCALSDPASRPGDFRRPGHVFPLRAVSGGVLMRRGHTEAAVDLAMLAGHDPCGVICEIALDDGEMARLPDLLKFGKAHKLPVVSIDDLVRYMRFQQAWAHEAAA
jgi:3,4-dihydroxy-2-butanone 4-phosphate synthase